MDHSSLADTQPRELEKACVSQASTTLDLQDGVAQTFIVDLALLGGRESGEPRKDDVKNMPTGEHQTDDSHSAPPSPHELHEKTLPPPLSVDVPPSSPSPTTDSEGIDTPIEPPPGLPRPVDDASTEVKETVRVLAVEDRDTERATPSCFSLSDLEPLRTLIPEDLLPDDLLVFDPDNISKLDASESHPNEPVRYARVFPQPTKSLQEPSCTGESPAGGRDRDRPVRVARLYLKENNVLGGGHHSSVYSAPLRLRLTAESDEESTVRVGVKTAFARCGAHEMLRREAVAYNAFPRHLMEDKFPSVEAPRPAASTEANSATPEGVAHVETGDATGAADAPASTSSESESDSDESADEGDKCSSTHTPPHEPAVVPKFFGYYAAVDADGKVIQHAHPKCDKDATCAVAWPTRLLLVEECGKPVVLRRLTYDQRHVMLFKRLHAAGFTQGSIYERNILVQPGPLSAPAKGRSEDTPSFRIIDFGRMKMRADFKSSGRFADECEEEREWAYDTLVGSYNRWY